MMSTSKIMITVLPIASAVGLRLGNEEEDWDFYETKFKDKVLYGMPNEMKKSKNKGVGFMRDIRRFFEKEKQPRRAYIKLAEWEQIVRDDFDKTKKSRMFFDGIKTRMVEMRTDLESWHLSKVVGNWRAVCDSPTAEREECTTAIETVLERLDRWADVEKRLPYDKSNITQTKLMISEDGRSNIMIARQGVEKWLVDHVVAKGKEQLKGTRKDKQRNKAVTKQILEELNELQNNTIKNTPMIDTEKGKTRLGHAQKYFQSEKSEIEEKLLEQTLKYQQGDTTVEETAFEPVMTKLDELLTEQANDYVKTDIQEARFVVESTLVNDIVHGYFDAAEEDVQQKKHPQENVISTTIKKMLQRLVDLQEGTLPRGERKITTAAGKSFIWKARDDIEKQLVDHIVKQGQQKQGGPAAQAELRNLQTEEINGTKVIKTENIENALRYFESEKEQVDEFIQESNATIVSEGNSKATMETLRGDLDTFRDKKNADGTSVIQTPYGKRHLENVRVRFEKRLSTEEYVKLKNEARKKQPKTEMDQKRMAAHRDNLAAWLGSSPEEISLGRTSSASTPSSEDLTAWLGSSP